MTTRRRDWSAARAKVERDGFCRYCGAEDGSTIPTENGPSRVRLEAAHLWPRSLGGGQEPDGIVGLCGPCHRRFDDHGLDLLSALSTAEQVETVRQAGGIERARRRLLPSEYQRSCRVETLAEIERRFDSGKE